MSLKAAVLGLMGDMILSPARVSNVKRLTERFRLIDLEASGFKSAVRGAGQKVEIDVGDGSMRTYTPISIDASTGCLRILTFVNGIGPGSAWAACVKAGNKVRVVGPRASLRVSTLNESAILFGDETSFGVAKTLQAQLGNVKTSFVFEVGSLEEARVALDELELGCAKLIEKHPDGVHLQNAALPIKEAMMERKAGELFFTGCAFSIRRVRAILSASGVDLRRSKVKAYWAPGKRGLD